MRRSNSGAGRWEQRVNQVFKGTNDCSTSPYYAHIFMPEIVEERKTSGIGERGDPRGGKMKRPRRRRGDKHDYRIFTFPFLL
jgi:hypothetical protein